MLLFIIITIIFAQLKKMLRTDPNEICLFFSETFLLSKKVAERCFNLIREIRCLCRKLLQFSIYTIRVVMLVMIMTEYKDL
jgi:hypothetical protein